MTTATKTNSRLADGNGKPMLANRGAAVASVGLENNAAVATLVTLKSEFDALVARLVAHGLIDA